jgi:muramoyltetrapeptide carboxypeptidase
MSLDRLKTGDIIDVVATSGGELGITADDIRNFVEDLGYTARLAENFQEKDADLFCANSDKVRFENLLSALKSHESDTIWMFRGGYGAAKLIPMLEEYDFSSHKKTIIGCSDVTAIGLYFENKYNWEFIHGRMIKNAMDKTQEEEFDNLEKLLSGDWTKIEYQMKTLNKVAKNTNDISSKITGGNLSLLQCSLGTMWQVDTKDKILFIEEVGEKAYAIDRMLVHLSQAGRFGEIKGLVFGDMSKEPNDLIKQTVGRFAESVSFPVFEIENCGHGKLNNPLIFNLEAQILTGEAPSLIFKNKAIDET